MGQTLDLGRRIELQPMDVHCEDISLGLYQRVVDTVPQFTVHTYSSISMASQRLGFVTRALKTMAGLIEVPGCSEWLRFPCNTLHLRAIKRVFLDLCKLESGAFLEAQPLTAFDKKANCNLSVKSLHNGKYQVHAEKDDDQAMRRAQALARGFSKLCEADLIDDVDNGFIFPCKTDHNDLIGMLMYRAQNVRASMREEESATARGVLSAPSQQDR